MILTRQNIHAGATDNGGFTRQQMVVLGVIRDGQQFRDAGSGWLTSLIGKEISEETYNLYVAARNIKAPKKKKKDLIVPDKDLSWSEQYNHPNWQRVRLSILARDSWTCTMCGNKQSQLHVHHLAYDKSKYIWDLPLKLFKTVCHDCHESLHGKKI